MSVNTLSIIKLIIDFGLVVLILMVQFTIYPSFRYFKRDDLVKWHISYTGQIAKVVGPLMILQLGIAVYAIFSGKLNVYDILYFLLVLSTWMSTAIQFVPIHTRITNNSHSDKDLDQLVNRNWLRVLLWISIMGISLSNYLLK